EWPETLVPVPFAGHLWFLQYLFLISLATLPLLLYLRTSNGRRMIARIADTCDCSGGIFLFAVPLAVALAGFRGLFEAQRSWADLAWYGTYFVIGYILAADHRLTRSVVRHSWVCCGLWVFGFVGGIGFLVLAVDYDPVPGRQSFSVIYLLYQAVWSVTSWSAVVFVLSLGAKYLNRDHSALTSATEAVLPFYLLHQTVILAVGFFVVRFSLTLLSKLMLVIAISFPITVALCELLVRPFNAARCLFGMKATTRPRAVLGALSGRAAP
ncbi:MAG: acyltransferase family protein, partial [Anaerolineae bacterium]